MDNFSSKACSVSSLLNQHRFVPASTLLAQPAPLPSHLGKHRVPFVFRSQGYIDAGHLSFLTWVRAAFHSAPVRSTIFIASHNLSFADTSAGSFQAIFTFRTSHL